MDGAADVTVFLPLPHITTAFESCENQRFLHTNPSMSASQRHCVSSRVISSHAKLLKEGMDRVGEGCGMRRGCSWREF